MKQGRRTTLTTGAEPSGLGGMDRVVGPKAAIRESTEIALLRAYQNGGELALKGLCSAMNCAQVRAAQSDFERVLAILEWQQVQTGDARDTD